MKISHREIKDLVESMMASEDKGTQDLQKSVELDKTIKQLFENIDSLREISKKLYQTGDKTSITLLKSMNQTMSSYVAKIVAYTQQSKRSVADTAVMQRPQQSLPANKEPNGSIPADEEE